MNVGRGILFLIIGLGVSFAANADIVNARTNREEEQKKEEEQKFICNGN